MKTMLFVLLFANVANAEEYKFNWESKHGYLSFKTEAKDWETAFKRASDFCFKFMVKKEKALTEDKGLEIIDICVNPR